MFPVLAFLSEFTYPCVFSLSFHHWAEMPEEETFKGQDLFRLPVSRLSFHGESAQKQNPMPGTAWWYKLFSS